MLFAQVGELASSKSAMKTLAPELSALTIILRSTGPVISTRRSSRSAGIGATRQSAIVADHLGAGPEIRQFAGVIALLLLGARREKTLAPGLELAMQVGEEAQRRRREHLGVARSPAAP